MRKEECTNCGNTAPVIRGNYRFDEIGLPVQLERIDLVKCPNCGNVDPIIPDLDGLMDCLALGVIFKREKLNGKEIRFLRKYLGKNQEEFASLVPTDATTLSKWENDLQAQGLKSDRLLRLLILNVSDRLEEPKKKIMELVSAKMKERKTKLCEQLHFNMETKHCEYVECGQGG
jgi:DNA-binding transcriptional regulator YiaG